MRPLSAAAAILAGLLFSAPAFAQGVPRCPNLLVVFDVSGSMTTKDTPNSSGANSKRYVVGRDAVKTLLKSNPDQLRFGLELFGDVAAPGGSCGISSATCFFPANSCHSVACGYGAQDDIIAVLDSLGDSDVSGSTPTGPAMTEAAKRADMNDTQRPRYVILLTDGDPSSCSSNPVQDAFNAIAAMRQNLGVKTFVLGFAGGSPSNLNRMAEEGGTARYPGQCNTSDKKCYYEANDATQLQTALNQIVNVVGGELGGFACDDSCYAQGCPSGQVCQNSACVADPCASVTCGAGSACVDGVCKQFCQETCVGNQRCENGACVTDTVCPGGCNGRNQTCVNGACVEDLCSGETGSLQCPDTHVCYKNACQLKYTPPKPDAGTSTDGGTGPEGNEVPAGGCCSGAPGAFNVLALGLGVLALRLFRRRALL